MENVKSFSTEVVNIISGKKTDVASTTDIRKLMELINTTDNKELLVKLFTVLAVYLVSNNNQRGYIITSNYIYDKLRIVLSEGQWAKTARTLNFISALLYQNEEEVGPTRAKTLVLYAQNMIRISGCLLIMCNMFTGCMLHQETWRALCLCLAESCRKSTENQSYCSHLVPMVIQKCVQGNMEAMEILKCLLYNHEYNMELFAKSNGIAIFSRRETLLNDTSMQLLNSLVQNSTPEMLLMIHETVFPNLNHFKHLYGTQNRIGQWATIIWHHLNSRIKFTKGLIDNNDQLDINNDDEQETGNKSSRFDIEFLKSNDTTKLLQNVMREIHQFHAKNNAVQNMTRLTNESKTYNIINKPYPKKYLTQKKDLAMISHTKKSRKLKERNENRNEMSFSFLLNKHCNKNIGISESNKTSRLQITGNPTTTHSSNCFQMETRTTDLTNKYFSPRDVTFLSNASVFYNEEPSLLEFEPVYVSTPKKFKGIRKSKHLGKSFARSKQNTLKNIDKVIDTTIKSSRISEDTVKAKQDLKNRSMTSRLFHAINDSCTTLVKTVKNIFHSKKHDNNVRNESAICHATTGNNVEPSCSYSFTDYMRKRDALLSNETGETKHNFGHVQETENKTFCKTCNDTVSLKYKVNNNQYLKETVSKLKVGINLYGCDFKKISRAMWPRDTYMTPEVLYNLYRKLIIK